MSPADATKTAVAKYRKLIERTTTSSNPNTTVVDPKHDPRVLWLLDAQRDLVHRADGAKILFFLLKELYDQEVFGEQVVLAWWADERSTQGGADEGLVRVRELAGQFVRWLEEAESESEGEDEDEDEDEDEEED